MNNKLIPKINREKPKNNWNKPQNSWNKPQNSSDKPQNNWTKSKLKKKPTQYHKFKRFSNNKFLHKPVSKEKLRNWGKIFNISKTPVICPYIWQSQWNNLHLQYRSLLVHRLIQKHLLKKSLLVNIFLNKYYIQINHNTLKINAKTLSIFKKRKRKSKKSLVKYDEKGNRLKEKTPDEEKEDKKLENKLALNKLGKVLLQINKVTYVKLTFYHLYLSKKRILKNAPRIFKKEKYERFFWESLQLVYAVFKGYASASVLASLIYTYTRRNPRRLRFVLYIKRLLNLHFRSLSKSRIQGVRIEIKGRFNAKSRARKRIISSGRVRIHEILSNVDYAYINPITKFGCLGIKVWVCPKKLKKARKLKKNVNNTKKNKI